MVTEKTTVVAVGPDSLWVEARQAGHCQGCSLDNGCGRALLNRLRGGRPAPVKVRVHDRHRLARARVGDQVTLGIPEGRILILSLFFYLVPLAGLLSASILATVLGGSEGAAILAGLLGLGTGVVLVRCRELRTGGGAEAVFMSVGSGDPARETQVNIIRTEH